MNLAIIGDEGLERFFDNICMENNYKIAQLNGKSCAFLRADNDFLKNLEIIKKIGVQKVVEITEKDIPLKQEKYIEGLGIEYTGFSVKGRKKYVKALISSAVSQSQSEKLKLLTGREREVLSLLAKGMTNKDIAQSLFLSEKTVKNHLNNVFKKIDVVDRTNAALFALKNNLE